MEDLGKTLAESVQKKALDEQTNKLTVFIEDMAAEGFTIVPIVEMVMIPAGGSLNWQPTGCSYKVIPIAEENKKRAKENREKRIADEQKKNTVIEE